jgi:hypothetical protein
MFAERDLYIRSWIQRFYPKSDSSYVQGKLGYHSEGKLFIYEREWEWDEKDDWIDLSLFSSYEIYNGIFLIYLRIWAYDKLMRKYFLS